VIKDWKITQRAAAEKYGIPRSTFINKLVKHHPKDVGMPSVLNREEEK